LRDTYVKAKTASSTSDRYFTIFCSTSEGHLQSIDREACTGTPSDWVDGALISSVEAKPGVSKSSAMVIVVEAATQEFCTQILFSYTHGRGGKIK
jgi:hypothetical protein